MPALVHDGHAITPIAGHHRISGRDRAPAAAAARRRLWPRARARDRLCRRLRHPSGEQSARAANICRTNLDADDEASLGWQRHWMAHRLRCAGEHAGERSPDTGKFCHGDAPTMADICLIPQMANARRVEMDLAPWPDARADRRGGLRASRLRRRAAEEPARCRVIEAARLDLDDFLPYRLSVLTNRVSGAIARHYSERFGLSVPEWRVMAVLGRARRACRRARWRSAPRWTRCR